MTTRTRKPSTAPKLQAADLFCGGGGFTTGAEQSGRVDVVLAINHWRTAIFTHQNNYPKVRHICARIDDIDPRHDKTIPELDVLLASPECTHHSIARGGRPIDDQKRATPWHICVWAEAKRPRWLVIENVREFRDWGPLGDDGQPIKSRKGEIFRQWIRALEAIGYQIDHQILNAADFGAATKRLRLFIVARRGHSRRDIPWPEATHAGHWRPAYEIIDWSKPCPSIFSRKRPLAEKTLRRIEIGLRKFVGQVAEPFIVVLRRKMDGRSTAEPLATITAGAEHQALAVPFQFKAMGNNPGLTRGIDETVPTIVAARENHAIVVPFLVPHFGERDGQEPRTHSIGEPAPTVTGQGAGSLTVPFILPRAGIYDSKNSLKRSRSIEEALPTIIAGDGTGHLVLPFLTKYYGTGSVQGTGEPLDVVTTKDRFGLAMVSLVATMRGLGVVDIGFRMLDVDELARAQGFPEHYYLHGTRAEQVRQVGNAVCPPVAKALCETIAGAV
jgi:DNA (cytosine-5)-methyltransferase 1